MYSDEENLDIGLGDTVTFKAKGLFGVEEKHTGCVVAIYLNGKVKVRAEAGLLYSIHKSEAELLRRAG